MPRPTAMLALLALPLAACSVDLPDVNILSLEDDMQLGAELHAEIMSDPDAYPVIDEGAYPEAYGHLYRIADQVLDSSEIRYRDEFDWQFYLIHDDETLNAFAAPGGYLYFYTGLIRFLDEEDHLAGVVGHEIAHADRRHSTQQLTKAVGVQTLLQIAFGKDPGLLPQVAAALVQLDFSRADEAESDEYSVAYLCETDWAADGAAGFFAKLNEGNGIEIPEFLSTHPSSASRVEDIRAEAQARGCSTELNPDAQYEAFLASLP